MTEKTPLTRYFHSTSKALRDTTNTTGQNQVKHTSKPSTGQQSITSYFSTRTKKRTVAFHYSSAENGKKSRVQVNECETETSTSHLLGNGGSFMWSSSSSREEETSFSCDEINLPEEPYVDYSLETVLHPQICSTAFKSISAEVLSRLLISMSPEAFRNKFFLVDCRYPYEYNGGHVKGAVNLHDPNDIVRIFFPSDRDLFATIARKIPIFYCEFSQKRGPTMARMLREWDRKRNRYPEVNYKEIYLVDQGYNAFYKFANNNCGLCEPNAYVPMVEPSFAGELRKYKLHRSTKSRTHHERRGRRKKLLCTNLLFSMSQSSFEHADVEMKAHEDEDEPMLPLSQPEQGTVGFSIREELEVSPTQLRFFQSSQGFQ